MRDTSKLDWMVPADEWDQFRRHVEFKFGTVAGYLGREAELAMKQYIDADGYARVETLVDRLVSAAGRSPDHASEKIKSDLASQEPTRIGIRVGTILKEEFCAYVDEHTDHNYGVALARALNVYRDGGRSRRVEDKLDRVVDDAESMLGELNDDSDDSLSSVQRKTIAICHDVGESFTDEVLNESIHNIAAEGPKASDPTLEKYRDLVVNRLDYERHPNNEELWISRDQAEEISPDETPAECRRSVELLDTDEMKRRVIYTVGRRAMATSSKDVTLPERELREAVFDDEISRPTMHEVMQAAAEHFGIGTGKPDRQQVLRLNLTELEIDHPDMARTIRRFANADGDSKLADSGETTLGSYGGGQQPSAMTDGGTVAD
ncbi:hypothetical protein [Haloarcula argentinensis]|uniref:Uncharacterized protein n=1 Tax=Haloarcula argentinensis TaxID=43776 RepID=A0A830FWM7_HALAR|nr:hypothetical protein [Haloarcula argentinensis]GGM52939.1 hypothetical protein GCM10009006_37580 [Haloarcula argentinensis]